MDVRLAGKATLDADKWQQSLISVCLGLESAEQYHRGVFLFIIL